MSITLAVESFWKVRHTRTMTSAPRQRLSPIERRAQLMACAFEAFADTGLERAGHGDVAKLAGVSTATVFNYFPTREALTNAVLFEITEKIMTLLASVPPSSLSPPDQIRIMARAYDQLTENHPNLSKVMLNWSVCFGEDLRNKYLEFQEELLTQISLRLNSKRPDRSDARIILGSANIYAMMKLDQTEPDIMHRFVERLAEALR